MASFWFLWYFVEWLFLNLLLCIKRLVKEWPPPEWISTAWSIGATSSKQTQNWNIQNANQKMGTKTSQVFVLLKSHISSSPWSLSWLLSLLQIRAERASNLVADPRASTMTWFQIQWLPTVSYASENRRLSLESSKPKRCDTPNSSCYWVKERPIAKGNKRFHLPFPSRGAQSGRSCPAQSALWFWPSAPWTSAQYSWVGLSKSVLPYYCIKSLCQLCNLCSTICVLAVLSV